MILDVYLYSKLIGNIYTDSNLGFCFKYKEDASFPISISLPLSDEVYKSKEAEPFFSGLLPDGEIRSKLARNAHVREGSTIGLLDAYGADIAGAVVILKHNEEYKEKKQSYREISENQIAEKIRGVSSSSLLLWGKEVRLSLAGAQEKVPLYKNGDKWFLPEGTSPSNSIIKPSNELSINEHVVTLIAKELGIPAPINYLYLFGGERSLVSERYDRVEINGSVVRLQQEDMCQALAIAPEKKYEGDGGPGISDILSLIEKYSSNPVEDMRSFLMVIVFNYLIGNCDAHGKNFSFLYGYEKTSIRLAPFYDLMSTSVYPGLSRTLAMKVGKEKRLDRMRRDDFLSIPNTNPKQMDRIINSVVNNIRPAVDKVLSAVSFSEERVFIDQLMKDMNPRIKRLRET